MDDARGVRGGERIEDLARHLHRLADRQRSPAQAVGKRLAIEQLHHQERRVATLDHRDADVVQRADVRMAQPRDGAGFPLEAVAAMRIGRQVGSRAP